MTIHAKTLRIRFDKVDGIVKTYDGTRYLVLFVPEKYGAIYVRFRYHISETSAITYSINHNFARIRFDSYNFYL